MDDNKILDELLLLEEKEILSNEDIDKIITYANSENAEIRSFVAELLVAVNSEQSKNTLINLAMDEDCLVRTNACDSLCIFDDDKVIELLKHISLEDKDELVRTYSILSLGDIIFTKEHKIQEEFICFFQTLLLGKLSAQEQTAIYAELYRFGLTGYLHQVLEKINYEDYSLCCFSLNILEQIATENNKREIADALVRIKETEKNEDIKTRIDTVLNAL